MIIFRVWNYRLRGALVVSKSSVLLSVVFAVFLLVSVVARPASAAVQPGQHPALYVPGQILVKYKKHGDSSRILARLGISSEREQRFIGGEARLSLIKLSGYMNVMEAVRTLRASGLVEYAEPNYYRYPLATTKACDTTIVANHPEDSGQSCTTPNDPDIANAWYINNEGNSAGTAVAGADMNLLAAWHIVKDADDVKVAVVDDGFDLDNPDLAFDGTGVSCVSDKACNGTAAATKTDGTEDHGTYVSGSLAAVGDNGVGTAGVAWHTDLLPIKTDLSVASIANGIRYAVDHGAKIINESFGGPTPSDTEYDALKYALDHDVLVIVSAGNSDSNNDIAGAAYPANYGADSVIFPNESSDGTAIAGTTTTKPGLPNVLAVGASDSNDDVTYWSQWGSFNVALLAPGEGIYATQRGNQGKTTAVDGTSFSAPLTSGVAALAAEHLYGASTATSFNYREIKAQLLAGTDPGAYNPLKPATAGALRGRSATGRLNAYLALQPVTSAVMLVRGVSIDDAVTVDTGNNANGELDSGETVILNVAVANTGDTSDTSVSGILSYLGTATKSATSYATVLTVAPVAATLAAPTSGTLVDPEAKLGFEVQIGQIPDNESLLFELDLTAQPSNTTQKRYFYVEAGSLTNGTPLVTRIGRNDFDDFQAFHIDVPTGARNLIITTRTDNGTDIDLLAQKDALPQYLETLGPNPDANPEFQQYIDPNTQISGFKDGDETLAYGDLANPFNADGAANPQTSEGTYHIVVVNFTGSRSVGYSIEACYAPAGSDEITFAGNAEVAEDAGTATLTLLRSGSSGAVSIHYATSDGDTAPVNSADDKDPAAIAGTNYTSSSGTVSWTDGDSEPKNISIPILNTGTIGSTAPDMKHFTVKLSDLTGGSAATRLGCLTTETVAITEAANSDSGGSTTTTPPESSDSGKSGGGGSFGLFTLLVLLAAGSRIRRRS
ncbi:MAG TPA: S8 family serine peptidase [Gammaproteobacteria bacterium]|nr:S8 family serine peptidase [Gammaproteobacteria bacterium]